ncbi:large ribosomal subunit protein bL21m [Bacillus rossius redtenbacheri]|uniref:large ribosomal subunit protein bL21m n=1 Tax=Bacillus rossius redtenbacheri TaxID=93214 RepID=UPI002FDDBC14
MALVFRKQMLQKCYSKVIAPLLEKAIIYRNFISSSAGRLPAMACAEPLVACVTRQLSQGAVPEVLAKPVHQEEVVEDHEQDDHITRDVISKVNKQIESKSHGRLFAIVHICGKQFKITDEDIIIIEGHWPPEMGDELKLEKVLMVGGSDFTLIGRPVLSAELVTVNATVIEKTLSYVKTRFRKKKRKQYMRINFHRSPYTMLRINTIEIKGKVNEKKDVEGIEERIF